MINRLILASACLLLTLMPGVAGWQAHNTSISLHEIASNGKWITTSREEKPVFSAVKKRSGKVIAIKPTAPNGQHNQTPAQLWQQLKMLLGQSDFQQIPIIGTLLAERLRQHPDPDVYQSIADLLLQPDVPVENKAILLDLLADIATPKSLAQLINLAEQGTDFPLYLLVLQVISRIGDNRWDGKFHEELSPVLETAWSNPGITDPAFLGAIGKAIAAVGAPEGVNQLLQTVSGSNTDNATEETNRIKQTVAFDAIPQVRNPDAVEVLSIWFKQELLGTSAFEVSANALVEIGSPKATQEIIDWAKDAPAEGARNLKDWLVKIDDAPSLKVISTAQTQTFQSPEIKAVFDTAAASINASAALSVTTMDEPVPLLGN
ncbi:MAG: HEAT repeat domain-containing protein [Methylovulum sp.]|nr:HEAT repeat domain-containing protein [Methylovulum sp.]